LIVKIHFKQDLLSFPAFQLEKCFKLGDHVKVVAGPYEGETGLITKVQDNASTIFLFSDLTSNEVAHLFVALFIRIDQSLGL
jgi:transcription elongation factor